MGINYKNIFRYTYYRVRFIFKYKTLKAVKNVNESQIAAPCAQGIFVLGRRCPHQGALLNRSKITSDRIICHWHGCKIKINSGQKIA